MNLKEKLGLCSTKFHFGRSVATAQITGTKHNGEKVLVKQNLCKKCFDKIIQEATKEADKISLTFDDDSIITFEDDYEFDDDWE